MDKKFYFLLIVLAAAWLVAMSSVAIHKTISPTSDSYDNFVKYFAGISIGFGGVAIILSTVFYVQEKRN